jgi:hypothetical protein
VLTAVTVSPVQLATGSSTSPYQAGYNHGCSDARISDPSERYINQPERGPSFHTNEFMRGYNAATALAQETTVVVVTVPVRLQKDRGTVKQKDSGMQ